MPATITLKNALGKPIQFEEGASGRLTVTFEDEDDVQVPLTGLTTVLFTLFNKADNKIINGRDAQDVKNAGIGAIDAAGELIVRLTPADNAISGTDSGETHVARFTWTYNDGVAVRTGKSKLIEFPVCNHPATIA